MLVTQLGPTLCDPMDCSPPGCSVHGILQARILWWVAISFSRGPSWCRDGTQVSCIARQILYHQVRLLIVKLVLEKHLILKFWKWFGNISFSGANTELIFIPKQWKIFLINRTKYSSMSQLRKLIGTFRQEWRKERKDKDRDVHLKNLYFDKILSVKLKPMTIQEFSFTAVIIMMIC